MLETLTCGVMNAVVTLYHGQKQEHFDKCQINSFIVAIFSQNLSDYKRKC